MSRAFLNNTSFNHDIGEWDVSNVRYMSNMFKGAEKFEGRGLDKWRPSKALEDMSFMFEGALKFNADLGEWDVSKVRNMSSMFHNAVAFEGLGLDKWRPSKALEETAFMFLDALKFNADLGEWKVSEVRNMSSMFHNAVAFEGLGLEKWRPSKALEDMSFMFDGALKFNADLGEWDVSEVRNMSSMFHNAVAFEGLGLDKWRPSKALEETAFMFHDALKFNADLGEWKVSEVINMSSMFHNAVAFEGLGLEKWRPSKALEDMSFMFDGALKFNADLGEWKVSDIRNMSYMFRNAVAFEGLGLDKWRPPKELDEGFVGMFDGALKFNADLGEWKVSDIRNMSYMFRNAVAFEGLGLDKWRPSKAFSLAKSMFENAFKFNADLSQWDFSGLVEHKSMFENTRAFTKIILLNQIHLRSEGSNG